MVIAGGGAKRDVEQYQNDRIMIVLRNLKLVHQLYVVCNCCQCASFAPQTVHKIVAPALLKKHALAVRCRYVTVDKYVTKDLLIVSGCLISPTRAGLKRKTPV